jgi:hypothetical protein
VSRLPDPSVKTIPNCAAVKIMWTASGRTFSNVMHGQWTGAGSPTSALAEALFSGFKSAFTSSGLAGQIHTDVSMTGVEVKDLRQPNLAWVLSSSASAAGSGAGTFVSLAAAIVVTLATAQSGRGFAGRVYISGLDSGAILNHLQATAAADTAAAAFITACMGTMSSNSIPLVIAQRALLAGTTSGGAQLPPRPAGTIAVTQARIVKSRLDTQRRRLGR